MRFTPPFLRRIAFLFFRQRVEIIHHVTNRFELGESLVRNHDTVVVFESHEELEDVQGVGSEVFLNLCVEGDAGGIYAQLTREYGFDFVVHG